MKTRLFYTVRTVLSNSCARCGALSQLLSPRAGILAYHRIGESPFDPYGQTVSPGNFVEHLRHLQQYYHVISLNELLEQLPYRDYRDGTIAITFDDGYADNLTIAYPIARQFDVPITVFVTVQPILQSSLFWWDELALSMLQPESDTACGWRAATTDERCNALNQLQSFLKLVSGDTRRRVLEGLRYRAVVDAQSLTVGCPLTVGELQKLATLPCVTIGSHTMTHPVLRMLSIQAQKDEFVSSKKILEELTGKSITTVAYPFGKSVDISLDTTSLAAEAGYRAAFTTIAKPVLCAHHQYMLPRLTVHDWSGKTFAQQLHNTFGRPPNYLTSSTSGMKSCAASDTEAAK